MKVKMSPQMKFLLTNSHRFNKVKKAKKDINEEIKNAVIEAVCNSRATPKDMKVKMSPQMRFLLTNSHRFNKVKKAKKDINEEIENAAIEAVCNSRATPKDLKRLFDSYHLNEHTKKVYGVPFNDNLTIEQLYAIEDSIWEAVPTVKGAFWTELDPDISIDYDSLEYISFAALSHLNKALLALSKILPPERRDKVTLADLRKLFKF